MKRSYKNICTQVDGFNSSSIRHEKRIARDPVCGMLIDENHAAGESRYESEVYFFCSPGCLKVFNISPDKYLSNTRIVKHISNVIAGKID